eukprot:7944486-Pyramimonas_sp.AAC.1
MLRKQPILFGLAGIVFAPIAILMHGAKRRASNKQVPCPYCHPPVTCHTALRGHSKGGVVWSNEDADRASNTTTDRESSRTRCSRVPFPAIWLTHQEYALFPPAIGSHRRRCSRVPGASRAYTVRGGQDGKGARVGGVSKGDTAGAGPKGRAVGESREVDKAVRKGEGSLGC